MKLTTFPFAVLGFQYKVARIPLQLIEDRLFARMDAETPARLFYERSLGMMDAAVGSALGDSELKMRGEALAERSDALSRAARLDVAAARKEAHAAADLRSTLDNVAEKSARARASANRDVKQAWTEAEERKSDAAQAAGERAEAGKHQADEVAKRRTDSVNEAKRVAQENIRANEGKASAAAKSQLDSAQAKQSEADHRRAQAERVEQLADAEKQKRQEATSRKS
jgi:hypothetical protein